jgi:guanine deaminase
MTDSDYLRIALDQAKESVSKGGFPAGAIIVKNGIIIAKGISIGSMLNDPTGHAETAAIRQACNSLRTTDLSGAILYESLACCTMCFSVANWAGITKIVSGSKKTPEMVAKRYYEGQTDIAKLNEENTRKIELIYIPDIENESLELVKQWERETGI